MAFLNPLVLLGLAAAAIPILVHLFNFRKPKRVDFSSLAFLHELQKSTMRRVRIKQWLLLVLRTLAIACLVLAFARPTVQSGWATVFGGQVQTSTALVLDHSLSMTVRDAQGDLLTQAQELASAVVETSETGDEVFVVGTAATSAETFRNAGPALDAIAELEPEAGAGTAGSALGRAFALLEGATNLNREVLVVSDLQASTFLDSARVPVPEGVRVTLLPVGERRHANVAVTEARVVSRIVEAGQPVEVEATLVHYGAEPLEGYAASLYLGGERVAQATADLAPGVPATVTFTATPQARGWLPAEVRTEEDAFAWDNTRYLTLHVPETCRVLLVRGEGQRADLVDLALSLGGEQTRFAVTTVPETALAAQDLATFDVAVLVGPESLASGEVAALAQFVQQGGGLMVFPSDRARPPDYDALFAALGGGRLGAVVGQLGGAQPVAQFGRVDLEHPLFDGVFDGSAGQARLESPAIALARPYRPGVGDENTLIALSTGAPFLQELRSGQGTAFVFAVAPDPRWSDFPVRGLFVPLLYRAVYTLAAAADTGKALTVRQAGALRVSGTRPSGGADGLRLVGPDGTEFAPEQRSVPGGVLLEIDDTVREPGVYEVMQGERLVRRVAFNPDARESDLTPLAPDEARRRLIAATGADVQLLDASGGQGLAAAERIAEERTGVELWNVFLTAALLFLLAEMLVAMQWRPEPVAA
ncbi:MAG: BatA and WFA domain-containing protein [Bacteroidota bacterium]